MSINLTNEEAMVLSKLAYMNIADEAIFKKNFNNSTLKEMAQRLIDDKNEGNPRDFGSYGSLTNKEHYEMLQKIVDGEYPNLSNLKIKDYDNQNATNGFVAYAFSDGKDTVCAFRGSEGNIVGDDGFLSTVDGKTGIDWMDNYYIGLRNTSAQFKSVEEFMKRNMVEGGQTFVTGHSKGAANAAYAAAAFDGVTGFAFDGPGIGQCLSAEQIERLKKSGFINCVDQNDPVGSLLFHPEKRVYAQHNTSYELDINGNVVLDENGNPKVITGVFAGHYTQGIVFNKDGSVQIGKRNWKCIALEVGSKALWSVNELLGQPLGDLVDSVKFIKTEVEIIGYLFSDHSLWDKITYFFDKEATLLKEILTTKFDSLMVKFQRIADCIVWLEKNVLDKLLLIIVSNIKEFGNMLKDFSDKLKDSLDKLGDKIKDGWDKAKSFISNIINNIKEKGNDFVDGINDLKDKIKDSLTNFFKNIANKLKKFILAIGEKGKSIWEGAKDKAKILIASSKEKIKQAYEVFKDRANYLVSYSKKAIENLGDKARSALRDFGKKVALGMGAYMSGRLMVDLVKLADLQSKMISLERYFGERMARILKDAKKITTEISASYSESYVRQQVYSVESLCGRIAEKSNRVCGALQRKTKSLQYALEHFKQIEKLLCDKIRE